MTDAAGSHAAGGASSRPLIIGVVADVPDVVVTEAAALGVELGCPIVFATVEPLRYSISTLPDGSVLDVSIPAGTRDGQTLRLRGKGSPGLNGGAPGDALVEVDVRPHPVFTRKDDDIHVELQLPLADAVLGGKINVPTIDGSVTMTVPKWSNSGRTLRLKGKGVKRADGGPGDEYVTLKIMLPDKPDPELEKLVSEWQHGTGAPRHSTEA